MARSRWKKVYFDYGIWRKLKKMERKNYLDMIPVIYNRSSSIPESFYPAILKVHKGKITSRLVVSDLHHNYKFGEFSYTRKPFYFPMKRSNKKN